MFFRPCVFPAAASLPAGPALAVAHTGTALNLLLCNNTHIHRPQTANCFSHSPPRPAFVLSHLQNKLCWKFHYKLPCVCQIPPGAEEIKTLDLPAPIETELSLTRPHSCRWYFLVKCRWCNIFGLSCWTAGKCFNPYLKWRQAWVEVCRGEEQKPSESSHFTFVNTGSLSSSCFCGLRVNMTLWN